jgi:hypothetical protein
LPGASRFIAELVAKGWLLKETNRFVCHQRGVGSGKDHAGPAVFHYGVHAAERKRQDRTTRHLSFHRDARDAFVIAREQQQIEAAVDLLDLGPVPEKAHVGTEPTLAYLPLEPCPQRTITGDDEMHAIAVGEDAFEHLERPFRPLLVDQMTNESEQRDVFVDTHLMS